MFFNMKFQRPQVYTQQDDIILFKMSKKKGQGWKSFDPNRFKASATLKDSMVLSLNLLLKFAVCEHSSLCHLEMWVKCRLHWVERHHQYLKVYTGFRATYSIHSVSLCVGHTHPCPNICLVLHIRYERDNIPLLKAWHLIFSIPWYSHFLGYG